MKIFCIVVYTSLKKNEKFEASLNESWFAEEPHLRKIHNSTSWLLEMLNHYDGLHRLKTPEGIYYAHLNQDQLALVSTDAMLSSLQQLMLFEKISSARNAADLMKIINDPSPVVASKIDIIQEDLQETVEIMRENIDKMMARQENLDQILKKTEDLTVQTLKFSRKSADLKNQVRCPGLFYLWNSVRNLFGGETYDYDYEPAAQNKR